MTHTIPHIKLILPGGVLSVITLLVLYVLQINAVTHLVYAQGEYEAQVKELQEANKTLELYGTKKDFSVESLEKLAHQLYFEKLHTVTYLKVLDGVAARNPNR